MKKENEKKISICNFSDMPQFPSWKVAEINGFPIQFRLLIDYAPDYCAIHFECANSNMHKYWCSDSHTRMFLFSRLSVFQLGTVFNKCPRISIKALVLPSVCPSPRCVVSRLVACSSRSVRGLVLSLFVRWSVGPSVGRQYSRLTWWYMDYFLIQTKFGHCLVSSKCDSASMNLYKLVCLSVP